MERKVVRASLAVLSLGQFRSACTASSSGDASSRPGGVLTSGDLMHALALARVENEKGLEDGGETINVFGVSNANGDVVAGDGHMSC